jgi:hypothetical protein
MTSQERFLFVKKMQDAKQAIVDNVRNLTDKDIALFVNSPIILDLFLGRDSKETYADVLDDKQLEMKELFLKVLQLARNERQWNRLAQRLPFELSPRELCKVWKQAAREYGADLTHDLAIWLEEGSKIPLKKIYIKNAKPNQTQTTRQVIQCECAICFTTFCGVETSKSKAQYVLIELPCKHRFDKHCIKTWLQQHDTCPLCRQS